MHRYRCRMSIVGHTRVVAGVREGSLGHQQLAGGATLRLLRLQTDAPAGGVEVYY